MAQILNFKKVEVSGATKEEALEKSPFTMMGNATQAFENFKKNHPKGITETDVQEWMLAQLKEKTKMLPGAGLYIVRDAAVKNTRKRSYEYKNLKNTEGSRKFEKRSRWYDSVTGEVVAEAAATKKAAKTAIDKAYADGYTGNAILKVEAVCVKGQDILAETTYTPSKNTKPGIYVTFGIESI